MYYNHRLLLLLTLYLNFCLKVASVQNYGAFIRIPGNKQQGLVHRSQLSRVPVDDATEVLAKGDKIWAKVIGTVSKQTIYIFLFKLLKFLIFQRMMERFLCL